MDIRLEEADGLEVVVLVDNYCDELLNDTIVAKRFLAPSSHGMMGEAGLSMLVTVFKDKRSHTLLMDGGMSGTCLMHNLGMLPKGKTSVNGTVTGRSERVEAVVLSHGHSDHFKGLESFLARHSGTVPVIMHPFAGTPRRYQPENGPVHPMVTPDLEGFKGAGGIVEVRRGPSTTASGLVLVTGQIERHTDFETSTPGLQACIDGQWEPDPFWDDQALAVHVRDKGLVVISGCSHAGIINTVTYAKKITGVDALHCVMGGFHLPGTTGAPLTQRTIVEMKDLAPDYIVPMHCTGWNAINGFENQMAEQFILNAVGSAYLFGETAGSPPHNPNRKATKSC